MVFGELGLLRGGGFGPLSFTFGARHGMHNFRGEDGDKRRIKGQDKKERKGKAIQAAKQDRRWAAADRRAERRRQDRH